MATRSQTETLPTENPTVDGSPSNREDLEREIGDVLYEIDLMAHCGDVSILRVGGDSEPHRRKTRHLHHHELKGLPAG